MSFMTDYQKEQDEQRRLEAEWDLGEYRNPANGCPNCSRSRVCICPNGKHRCEKCNWVEALNDYCDHSL